MRKLIFLLLLAAPSLVMAQAPVDTIMVSPGKEGLYFYHVVEKGETLFGLGRRFQAEPAKIAAANGLTVKSPLKLYQLIKIPLNQANLEQGASTGGLQPLFHKVVRGETLYRIAEMHNGVPLERLKQWNKLPPSGIKTGQYLIVGWLKEAGGATPAAAPVAAAGAPAAPEATPAATSEAPSSPAPAAEAAEAPAGAAAAPPAEEEPSSRVSPGNGAFLAEVIAAERHKNRGAGPAALPAAREEPAPAPPAAGGQGGTASVAPASTTLPAAQPAAPPAAVTTAQDSPDGGTGAAPAPAPAKPAASAAPEDTAAENPFAVMLDKLSRRNQKKETAHTEPAAAPAQQPRHADTPATHPEAAPPEAAAAQPPATPQASPQPAAQPQPADTVQDAPAALATDSAKTPAPSAFAADYLKQTAGGSTVTVKKGAAGWFRSNVEPGSGRYYALCDELPRGTIVKVTNPINGKEIYVKVLDGIPKLKENYNIVIKVSDAAMEDLGTRQPRFWCELRYPKPKD